MFIITNREVDESKRGLNKIGRKLNSLGANELRIVEANRVGREWKIKILEDMPTDKQKREVGIDIAKECNAGEYVARRLLARLNPRRARKLGVSGSARVGRNLLLFVHGFNNNIKAVLDRAHKLESNFDVEVLSFSWPANGGGARGALSYKSDKRDARASVGALDRTLAAIIRRLNEFNEGYIADIRKEASKRFIEDQEKRDQYISTMINNGCPFAVSAIFHSMGNYLFKHLLKSGASEGSGLLFDNVVLAAADTNNEAHAEWLDRIRSRCRVYVTINEDDGALKLSRMKGGEEQKARLGHYPYGLDSKQGVYVQFTDAAYVGDSHAYFEGRPVSRNGKIHRFFKDAVNGKRAEERLKFDVSRNIYGFAK